MTVIDKIKSKLLEYPSAKYSTINSSITVEPETSSGFTVWLVEKNPGYTVGYDGWHDEFDNEKDALDAFAFGLSDSCRLKVVKRGDLECAWILQGLDDSGQWREDSKTAIVFVPFWRKKTTLYRQNNLISNS